MAEIKPLIDEKEDRRYLCRYQVTMIFMVEDVSVTMTPSNLLLIEKEDNFDFDIRSQIHVKLNIDTRKVLWMMKNRDKLKCKFELTSVHQDPDGLNNVSGGAIIWSSIFSVMFNETDVTQDLAATEQTMAVNEGGQTPMKDLENESLWERTVFDVYLYDAGNLRRGKKTVNRVFTSATLQNIIGELCTEVGQNKVYLSPIENKKTFSNFCVPPLKFETALAYLDLYYGFYSSGAQIYFDVDTLYIINANGKVTAHAKEEWVETTFLVTSRNLSMPGNGMVVKPEQKIYYLSISEENIAPQDPSLVTSATDGSVAKVITTESGSVDTASGGTDSIGSAQSVKFVHGTNNPYWPSMIKCRMAENQCIEKITIENADVRAFGLNKTFKLVFEEPDKQKKFGGNRYRIAYANHVFRIESDQYMICTSQVALKACSNA